jgi:chromosome segregation ATPase
VEAELEREAEYKDRLLAARKQALEASDKLRQAERVMSELAAARKKLEARQEQLKRLAAQLAQADNELSRAEDDLAAARARRDRFQACLDEADAISAGYSELLAARQQEAALADKLMAHRRLAERCHALERSVDAARADLESRRSALEAQIAELTGRCAPLAQAEEIEAGYAQLLAAREQKQVWENKREEHRRLMEHCHRLERHLAAARAELEPEFLPTTTVAAGSDGAVVGVMRIVRNPLRGLLRQWRLWRAYRTVMSWSQFWQGIWRWRQQGRGRELKPYHLF